MLEQRAMLHGRIKIRRGKRTDLFALAPLLSFPSPLAMEKKRVQHWRRLASDPAHDFYVAEEHEALQGMLLVSYVRTLLHFGWLAVLDVAVMPTASNDVGIALIDFAKARARKRGCQRMVVSPCLQNDQMPLTPLLETGFLRTGEVLSCLLREPS